VLLTGETGGYYEDYEEQPLAQLARALSEGFIYQGDPSRHRKGEARGEPSAHLPPQAFISFLQNHDQIGNRAMGERLHQIADEKKLMLGMSILLLNSQPPLLFMGEEWSASTPFYYFCDFEGELADAVREGRRREFASFPEFADAKAREKIPDPNAESTFLACKLRWQEVEEEPYCSSLAATRRLLALRSEHMVPLLKSGFIKSSATLVENRGLRVVWSFNAGELELIANFSDKELACVWPCGKPIWGVLNNPLPAWECAWFVRTV
jgi:maltooligosyltrehalose trehalohydrolase